MKPPRFFASHNFIPTTMILRTFLLSLLSATAATAAGPYNLVNLGLLDGTTSSALDVSNNRQVTGNAQTAATNPAPRLNAYSYSGSGPMVNLGVLPGSNNFSRGYAINDSGIIVGESDNNISNAFVYSGGVMTGLTRLAGDNTRGVAHNINNAGVIVGISSNGAVSRATHWTSSGGGYVPADLGTIAGTATATGRAWAINQNGVAAGLSTNSAATPLSQATLWNAGTITNLTSLGDGAQFSQAYALNDLNVVVGSSSTGQTVGQLLGTASTTSITRAFKWDTGVISEFEALQSL
jgi:probable HAF family extracellular repeat protein